MLRAGLGDLRGINDSMALSKAAFPSGSTARFSGVAAPHPPSGAVLSPQPPHGCERNAPAPPSERRHRPPGAFLPAARGRCRSRRRASKMAQPPPPFPGRFPPPPFRAFPPQAPGPFPPPPAPFSVPAARPPLPPFLLPPSSEPGPFFRGPAAPPLFPPWPSAERPPPPRDPEDEDAAQRQRDERWLAEFLARRGPPAAPPLPPGGASPELGRQLAVRALGAVSRLAALCRALRRREAEGCEEGWERERAEAEALLEGLRETVRPLREPGYLRELGRKAEKARKRRERLQRRKREARAAKEEEAARAAEREAEIDRWRAKCIQEVEEKNRVRKGGLGPLHQPSSLCLRPGQLCSEALMEQPRPCRGQRGFCGSPIRVQCWAPHDKKDIEALGARRSGAQSHGQQLREWVRQSREARGTPHCSLQPLRGGCVEVGSASAPINSDRMRGDGLKLCRGGSGWILREISNQKEQCCTCTNCPGVVGTLSLEELWH